MFFAPSLKKYSAYVPFNLLLKKYEPFETGTELKIRQALKFLCYELIGLPTEKESFEQLDDTDKANIADVLASIKFKQEKLPEDIERSFMQAYVVTDAELKTLAETLKKIQFQGSIPFATKAGKLSASETLGNFATQNISTIDYRWLIQNNFYLFRQLALLGNLVAVEHLFFNIAAKIVLENEPERKIHNEIYKVVQNDVFDSEFNDNYLPIIDFFYNRAPKQVKGKLLGNLIDSYVNWFVINPHALWLEFFWNKATPKQQELLLEYAENHICDLHANSRQILLLEFFLKNATPEQHQEIFDNQTFKNKIPELFSMAVDNKNFSVIDTLWNQATLEQQTDIFNRVVQKAVCMALDDENSPLIDFLRKKANPEQKQMIEQQQLQLDQLMNAPDENLSLIYTYWNDLTSEQQEDIFKPVIIKAASMAIDDQNTQLIDFLRENTNLEQKKIIEQKLELTQLRKALMGDDDLSSQPKLGL